MNLGFDLDEVVVACMDGISKLVMDEFGVSWYYDDYTCYDFVRMEFTKDKELNQKISSYLESTVPTVEFLGSLKPYEELVGYLRNFREAGHKIDLISSRPPTLTKATRDWLKENNVPFDKLSIIGRSVEKGTLAEGLDMFVDDEVGHLESMLRYKKHWKVGLFLVDRPYNNHYDGKDFIRVKEWKEIERRVKL